MTLNQNTCQLTDTGTNFPAGPVLNAEFSPDGGTALAADYTGNTVHIFSVNGPGSLTKTGTLPAICNGPASIAYSQFNDEAYVYCNDESPDQIAVLYILGPGNVIDSGTRITLGGNAGRCSLLWCKPDCGNP